MTTTKEKWHISLMIAIISVMIYLFIDNKIDDTQYNKIISQQAVDLALLKDSTKVLRSDKGLLYSQINSVKIESNTLKEALVKSGFEIRDLRDKGIKWRDLADFYKAKLETSGSGSTVIIDTVYISGKDTIRAKKFDWFNKYLTLGGLIKKDSVGIKYNYKTELFYTHEVTSKTTKVTMWLGDPNAVITTGTQITIQNKKSWIRPWMWGVAGLIGGHFLLK
jgi:hypothetical protein